MSIHLDEAATRARLARYLEDDRVREGLRAMTSDRALLAFFLMSVSEGEAMGAAGVAAIREEEIARLIHDIERQEREEQGHHQLSGDLARELFPEFFDAEGRYLHAGNLTGREYYTAVLQENRARLKERGAYSRLNLYLTTTFGYEVMVALYYGAVIEAVERSDLPAAVRARIASQLRRILAEEETHLEIAEQHDALLRSDRSGLGPAAVEMLEKLAALTAEDYEWAAELCMRHIAEMAGRYAAGPAYRAEIEARAPAAGA
ncbi:MAG: hypothetical protein R3263_01135 [Myxococcota bacterium]|nr:hypothetical protein [Myxococcota bacterium]